MSLIASLLINLYLCANKLFFFIEEDYLNPEVEDSYVDEVEGVEDRFTLESFSDLLLPSEPLAPSPRENENENIIDIRKNFPESWIFDSIYNVSLG